MQSACSKQHKYPAPVSHSEPTVKHCMNVNMCVSKVQGDGKSWLKARTTLILRKIEITQFLKIRLDQVPGRVRNTCRSCGNSARLLMRIARSITSCAIVGLRRRSVSLGGHRVLLTAALLAPVGCTQASDEAPQLSSIGINSIAVCYNFNCRSRSHVSLSRLEWAQVAGWFIPAAKNADDEREQIRHAVGWLEELIGRYTPTYRDVAGNLPENAQMPGQLDCIDESRNTTTYLKLLQTNGLLRFHAVVERAYRRALFDQHWSGQIEELANGERYVVDSWFQDNGMLPYVQTASSWKDIPLFSSYSDNSEEQKIPIDAPSANSTATAGNNSDNCASSSDNCVIHGGDSRTTQQ